MGKGGLAVPGSILGAGRRRFCQTSIAGVGDGAGAPAPLEKGGQRHSPACTPVVPNPSGCGGPGILWPHPMRG